MSQFEIEEPADPVAQPQERAQQRKRIFFDPTTDRQFPFLPARPTDAEVKAMLSRKNPECPLSKVVVSRKNLGAMQILERFAFNACVDPTRSCKGMSFAIYGGPGQGKTYVVKQWLATIKLPFLFVQSDSLTGTAMLFQMLIDKFREYGTPLVPQDSSESYVLPPVVIFFDEAHALSMDLRTGGLLNAMEAGDGWLRVAGGKKQKQLVIDCQDVCWIAASTDPGIIYKQSAAFYDRFRTHIEWEPAGPKEIAHIVRLDSQNKPEELPMDACELVAHYEINPRRAIAFADQMRMERRMRLSTWEEAAAIVANNVRIDKFGMPYKIVDILTALSKRTISDKNISSTATCRKEQFDSQFAPFLIANIEGRGPLALPTGKGWAITRAGCEELDKRKIQHDGYSVLAERYL